VSLYPLSFEEAVEGLLQVNPEENETATGAPEKGTPGR